ncbi:hypothetical protein CN373_23975 [Bacillus cereus]|nr:MULTISPECIES: hypothetical protein [Bacillus cereus group]EEL50591.1 hypothetical protein bcere0022_19850 [Bacillus cereus Rock3-44]PFA14405.1 hypothetical protein CN373_23975 [Bacillus cereus]PFN00613.1 hypothetical protein COJ55_24795 [Bacillus cereus]PFR27703.1 hypothetical protein COK19_09760 [Bacillus cereus]PGZ15581.1 hypothetical protein COE46_15555 [Bacillus cereus]
MRYIHGVCLSKEEEVIKKYRCAKVGPQHFLSMLAPNTQLVSTRSSTMGYLIVTTQRLIFVGETNVDEYFTVRDVSIDKVTGVISYIGRKAHAIKLLIGFIWGFASLIFYTLAGALKNILIELGAPLESDNIMLNLLIFLIYFGIPLYLIITGLVWKHKQIDLRIMAANDGNSAVGLSADLNLGMLTRIIYAIFKVDREKAWLSVDVANTGPDTYIMMRELGALVRDLQAGGIIGDYLDQWRDKDIENEIIDTQPQDSQVKSPNERSDLTVIPNPLSGQNIFKFKSDKLNNTNLDR